MAPHGTALVQRFDAEDSDGDIPLDNLVWVSDGTCVGVLVRHEQGVLAKNKDLVKAFGTDSQLEVCRIILDKGEMQVRRLGRTDKRGRSKPKGMARQP